MHHDDALQRVCCYVLQRVSNNTSTSNPQLRQKIVRAQNLKLLGIVYGVRTYKLWECRFKLSSEFASGPWGHCGLKPEHQRLAGQTLSLAIKG
jgi:hypothetical protein